MDEGGGRFECFSQAITIEQQDTNGKMKPMGRLTRKRKNSLQRLCKKNEKKKEASITNIGATTEDVEEQDEESSDLPAIASSTSATESVTMKNIKELKIARKTKKNFPNFSKIVESLNVNPFVFQKRLSRMDWRKLHSIDVDRVIREVDLDALESVLDTITFADIQGEDTRNFSDINFIKVFRIAQLMVEYLLHVQELLATHKEKLLETVKEMHRQVEQHRQKQAKLLNDLSILRPKFKQAKKTNHTYEVMLRVQNKCQHRQQTLHETQREQQLPMQQKQPSVGAQTVRCCPLCDKMFESAYYLDLHVARRHPKSDEVLEDKILAAVAKAEEIIASRVRAETSTALQAEIKLVQAMSQVEVQRAQATAQIQISSLEASVRESNAKLHEVQGQLQSQRLRDDMISPEKKQKDSKTQERLKEMNEKLQSLQQEMKLLNQDNTRLMKELTSAHSKVSHLQEKHEHLMSLGSDQGGQDLHVKQGKLTNHQSASTERCMSVERKKWKHNKSSSPEKSESEGKQIRCNQMVDKQFSSPKRKRKQSLQHNRPRTAHSPDKIKRPWSATKTLQDPSPTRHRKCKSQGSDFDDPIDTYVSQQYKQWKASLLSKQEGDESPGKDAPHLPSGSQSPTVESSTPKSPSGRQTPELEARFKDVGEKAFVMAKAEIEQDLVRAGENRLSKDDSGKVASKIATFEIQFGTKKIRREEGESSRRSLEEVARSRAKKKERLEAKEKRSAEEAMEEEARRKAEIADAATMDVGEDQPIPPSEKEKWLEEHPYKPIPQRPHVLSKYPHPPNVFSSTRDELTHRLDEQLGGELKKFGFGRDTAGISDTVYDAAKAALEKQHKNRVSNLQLNQKKTLEYERGAILWQTQRAVRERDIQIIESHFDVDSDYSSQHSPSAGSRSSSGTETDDSTRSHQDKKDGWSMRSPVIKSPQSSTSPAVRSPTSPLSPHLQVHEQVKRETSHISETLETLESVSGHKHNWGSDRKHVTYSTANIHSPHNHVNRFKTHRQSPPRSPRDAHRRKDPDDGKQTATYLFPTIAKFKQAEENNRFKDEDDNHGEAFGLGKWDSDEDVPALATTLRGKGKNRKNDCRKAPKSSEDCHDLNSDNGSEESKIFQELDAEIDEIIRL